MFDIRTVADTDLLVASRHLAGGASHSPLAGRTVTKQTVYNEIRRRQLSIDPPPGPAIDTDPRGPYRWDLEVDENDGYLCPMPNGETAGRCRAELVVEGIGWEYLGLDCEMARPLTDVHVESWTVRCTNGHVLEIGPNDGNGAPAFRLDRFLTGEGHTVDEDDDLAPVMLAVGDEVSFTGAQCGAGDPYDGEGTVVEIKGDLVAIEADGDNVCWAQIDSVKPLAADAPSHDPGTAQPTDAPPAGYAAAGDTRRATREIKLVSWSRLPIDDPGYLSIGSVFTVLDPKVPDGSGWWMVRAAVSGFDGEYLLSYAAHEQSEPFDAPVTTDDGRFSATPPEGLDDLIEWADLGIVYKADPRDMAATIKRLATALRDGTPATPPQVEMHYADHGVAGGFPHRAADCTPSGDYLPLPEMLGLLAEAKDRRDTVGARIAKPGVASPELVTEWGEAQTAEWRIVDEIVGQYRETVPTTPEAAARLLGRTDEPLPPLAVQVLGRDQADGPAGRWCPVQQMKCWEADCSKGCEITQPDPAP